jgi:ribosome maturation factor RimP
MSRREVYEARTEELILPLIERRGFELVDIEYVKEVNEWYLRVYIDKPGGITIEDCVDVSREFNEILDREDYIEDAYTFEVSSPGLLRPFKKDKDFERHLGDDVELKTYKAIDKVKEFTGSLKQYDKENVTIVTQDGQEMTFARADIAYIRQAIEF